MARAKRHFIPGYIWHITHRCHKREFLLKFSMEKDQTRIQSFVPLEYGGKYKSKFGVLAATTCKPDIAKWWSTLDGENPTTHEIWNKLNKKLKSGYWDSIL